MISIVLTMLMALQMAVSPGRGSGANAVPPPPAAIAFVQGAAVKASASFTVTTPSFTCGAGHLLYIFTSSGSASETFTVTTTSGNTISAVVTNAPGSGFMSSKGFAVTNCNGSSGTYTNTCTVGSSCILSIYEFSGATAVDSTNTCSGGSYSATCSVTTTSANTYVVGSIMTNNCVPAVPLTGWTNLGGSLSPALNSSAGVYGQLETSAGLKTMTPNNGSGCGYTSDVEMMVALK